MRDTFNAKPRLRKRWRGFCLGQASVVLNHRNQGIHGLLSVVAFSIQLNQIVVLRTQGHDFSHRFGIDRAAMAKLSTPERIDQMQALHAQRDAEMKKRGDATKTFYAGLNAEQKKTFDAETARFMQQGPGMRHHLPH
mgnify:CR=1 FL=1